MPPKRPASALSTNTHSVKRRTRLQNLDEKQLAIDRAVKADNSYKVYHTRRFKKTKQYRDENDEAVKAQILEEFIKGKFKER
jgi:hypothetical protein